MDTNSSSSVAPSSSGAPREDAAIGHVDRLWSPLLPCLRPPVPSRLAITPATIEACLLRVDRADARLLHAHRDLLRRCLASVAVDEPNAGAYWRRCPDTKPSHLVAPDATVAPDAVDACGMSWTQLAAVARTTGTTVQPYSDTTVHGTDQWSARGAVKYPNPKDIGASFYGSRHEAVVERAYVSTKPSYCGRLFAQASTGSDLAVLLSRDDGDDGLLPIAVDRPNGSSAKLYQCLERNRMAHFLSSIPNPLQRNVYALVDDVHPCDAFFDIDGHLSALPAAYVQQLRDEVATAAAPSDGGIGGVQTLEHVVFEDVLVHVTTFLSQQVLSYMTETRQHTPEFQGTSFYMAESAVLSASACAVGKISFHLHFRVGAKRVGERASSTDGSCAVPISEAPADEMPVAFSSVMELKHFADRVRLRVLALTASEAPEKQVLGALLTSVLDLGVYSRWRPFRLPYCVKSCSIRDALQQQQQQHGLPKAVQSTLGADPYRLTDLLLAEDAMKRTLNTLAPIGSIAHGVCVACSGGLEQPSTFSVVLRPLLPIAVGRTQFSDVRGPAVEAALEQIKVLDADARSREGTDATIPQPLMVPVVLPYVDRLMDLACVLRPLGILVASRPRSRAVAKRPRADMDGAQGDSDVDVGEGAIIDAQEEQSMHDDDAPPQSAEQQVTLPLGPVLGTPFPSGRRISVTSPSIRQAVWALFQCLHPVAFRTLRPDHLSVVYEDASQRSFYIYQKHSKYCLNLQRIHKQTFGQLYLTYGSIKFRCYSNDCACMPCARFSWDFVYPTNNIAMPADAAAAASPLIAIRAKLFPELNAEEVLQRYGVQHTPVSDHRVDTTTTGALSPATATSTETHVLA